VTLPLFTLTLTLPPWPPLQLARTVVFSQQFGDRASVDNVVLLLTDGPADVEVANTEPEAQLLKNAGATIVPVGITSR
jgi:hypothetical protein